MIARILLAIRSKNTRRQLKRFLASKYVLVDSPKISVGILDRISIDTCDMLVIDRAQIDEPVEDSLSEFKSSVNTPGVVVIVDSDDVEDRARLLKAGCDAVLPSDLSAAELSGVLETVLDRHLELSRESLSAQRNIRDPRLRDFVSKSPIMDDFMDLVQRVVPSSTSLLMLGETGVGKERLARAIHRASEREGAFVAVNLGALPETLLESELFGHEEGAFTGANRARRGCFELAHRGTLFLDEIGEMPTHFQVRLLRAIQEREVQRLGAEWPIKIDVRIMAATARDLDEMVREGHFRQDLLYRLGVVTLQVPPLRERRQDIPELIQSYIDHYSVEMGREVTGIAPEALTVLTAYHWPGNVRELINAIERATLLCTSKLITLVDLPQAVLAAKEPSFGIPDLSVFANPPPAWLSRPIRDIREEIVERFERAYLAAMLDQTGGRIDESARLAGLTPRALYGKMQRYGLKKEQFKPKKTGQ